MEADVGSLSRRRFLKAVGLATAGMAASSVISPGIASAAQASLQPVDAELLGQVEALLRPDITPKSVWGPDLAPVGALEEEAREDVRFLLCHHTAQPNNYSSESIDRYLSDIHRFHTSPSKGWPDIAYNFLIDRFGGIWEGREGSIEGPIKGSATGGSQGFAMLCCWLGNHHEEPPTPEARDSMIRLLAWQAHRYEIDTTPGSMAEFTSRGSQIHAKGTQVRTTTIAGHRDMSATVCPGDFAYPMVLDEFPAEVTNLRNQALLSVTPTTSTTSTTVAATTTTAVAVTATTTSTTERESIVTSGVTAPGSIDAASGQSQTPGGDDTSDIDWPLMGAVGAGAAAVGAAMWWQQGSEA